MIDIQMKQKELTKSFMTFLNWKRPIGLFGLYKTSWAL